MFFVAVAVMLALGIWSRPEGGVDAIKRVYDVDAGPDQAAIGGHGCRGCPLGGSLVKGE